VERKYVFFAFLNLQLGESFNFSYLEMAKPTSQFLLLLVLLLNTAQAVFVLVASFQMQVILYLHLVMKFLSTSLQASNQKIILGEI